MRAKTGAPPKTLAVSMIPQSVKEQGKGLIMTETESTLKEPWGSELDRGSTMKQEFAATMSSDLERATFERTETLEVNISQQEAPK